jgi:hypothetical protein
MAKLYEITSEIKEIESLDFDDETIADTLAAVQGEFKTKATAVLMVIGNYQADVDSIDAQIERLKLRKKTMENQRERLRDYLLTNMEASGITKIECPYFTASIRKGSESVQILNEENIPDDYMTTKVSISPDKKAIADAIKAGSEVPGAVLARGKNTITIR